MTKQKKIGAARINTSAGAAWRHYSQYGDTVILRQYSGGAVSVADIKNHDDCYFVPLQECKKLVDAPSYSYKCYDVWVEIFEKLGSKPATPSNHSSKTRR